jgi:hypothetical protein
MKKVLLVIALLLLFPFHSNAQVQNPAKPKKWNLQFSAGASAIYPSEKDFFKAGLPYWSISDFHNHLLWNYELSRTLGNKFSAGINSVRREFDGRVFTVLHKFITTGVSPILIYNIKDILYIGGGPSVYFVRQKSSYNHDNDLVYKMLKFGFESELSFRFPKKSRFYTHIDASYQYAGKNKVFEFMDVQSGRNVEPLFYYVRDLRLSYLYLGLGIGIRL